MLRMNKKKYSEDSKKTISRLIKNKCHLAFNITCLNSNFLPIHTKFIDLSEILRVKIQGSYFNLYKLKWCNNQYLINNKRFEVKIKDVSLLTYLTLSRFYGSIRPKI